MAAVLLSLLIRFCSESVVKGRKEVYYSYATQDFCECL